MQTRAAVNSTVSPATESSSKQLGALVDAVRQTAPAQRCRDSPRIFALAREQARDTGGLGSYCEAERAEILAPVGTESGDLAALAAIAVDDRDAIVAEERHGDGATAAHPVTFGARLEGRQARLANLRKPRHVRRVVHGGDLR